MTAMSNEMLDRKMRQIQALLDKADHPNTGSEESDACRAMAEKLMNKYRIEESELLERGELDAEINKPGSKRVWVCPSASEYNQSYLYMMGAAAQHSGVRWVYGTDWNDDQLYLYAVLVGYEMDIMFTELLYANARLVFADRMEPKRVATLSDEDNVYRMRSAGMERVRVSEVMGWGGNGTNGPVRVTAAYKRACKQRGEDPVLTGRKMNVKDYRAQYAAGFTDQFYTRLYQARNAAGIAGSGELVLANRKDTVDEAFYDLYPHLRPSTDPVKPSSKPRKYKWTAADQRRYERANSAAGRAGANAGRSAADEVDVNATKRQGRLQ